MSASSYSPRRVATAFAATVGIAAVVAVATILPANLSASARAAAEWEPARSALVAGWAALPEFDPVTPESITLLERTPGDGFFFAAVTQAGRTVIGITAANGTGVQCTAPDATPSAHGVGCATWAGPTAPHLYTWAAADPTSANGFRHELLTFPSEEALDAYLGSHPGLPRPVIAPLPGA
ncbi:hypothetical protein [Leucobacter chromiireducens]|uniref:Uncharacterized protein n=1 Tax=Leucobacter chromiireducens subsp. chromiireducens TaxID=660067 RepID=A0ABS1SK11_9MICO|nr:hypothetical protein [Leucobacter chromiireducens]MBL3688496.1 hypothetical protein [Leucobacter chromiireducens subsp. chromiireducens]